jgi:acetoin utilization protein AcuB
MSTPMMPVNSDSQMTFRLVMKDVMTPQPLTIGRDQTLAVAHRMMREHGVRHLPVLERGQLVGMLSERDLYYLETVAGIDLAKDRVDDGMSADAYAVSADESVHEVARVMADRKLGSAVIMDRGHVIGIFTAIDALRLLSMLVPPPSKHSF